MFQKDLFIICLKFANIIKVVGYTQTKGTSYKIFQYIGKKENDDVNV